jgi:hypothetical protein
MKNQKQPVTLEEFASTLVGLKFENDHPIKGFNRFLSKEIAARGDKLSDNHFLEYLIFDLFTDYACFLLAFSQEVSRMLFETYSTNILVRLLGEGYKVDWEEFWGLFNKRAIEYHPYLQEYDPEYIKTIDINKYVPGLGKAFSMNFVGYKNAIIIYIAHWGFVSKIRYIGRFLKDIAEKYEIVLQK